MEELNITKNENVLRVCRTENMDIISSRRLAKNLLHEKDIISKRLIQLNKDLEELGRFIDFNDLNDINLVCTNVK